ncbi:MAG: universal stress protein [Thermomicrobiales bacterium]
MTRWQQLRDWASRALSHPSEQPPAQPGSRPTPPSGDDLPRPAFAYRTLLVPLDGSPLAECALPFARRLAALSGARLVLVRTVAAGESGAARDAALTYLEAHADVLRETGVRVDALVPVGAAVEAIAATVAAERIDLIVMTTSGRFLLGHGASGLFAGLLARVAAPILLVRAWHDVAALETTTERGGARIVVPLDGSAVAEQALDSARSFAALLGGELVLVRAVPAAQPDLPTPGGQRRRTGWRAAPRTPKPTCATWRRDLPSAA